MAIIPKLTLLGWKEIEAATDLDRLRLVLEVLPDEKLMRHLEKLRGRGRNDYPLAFEVTKASESDAAHLLSLVEQSEEKHPELAERVEELAADRGYDSGELNSVLYEEHGIKPIIDTRRLWKEEPEERRELFFYGFEKDRQRCARIKGLWPLLRPKLPCAL